MEQDFVTAAFFRHAIAQRTLHMQQLDDMQQIMEGTHSDMEQIECTPRSRQAQAGQALPSDGQLLLESAILLTIAVSIA